jgi:hypothetical protein
VLLNKKKISGLKITVVALIAIPLGMIIIPQTQLGKTIGDKITSAFELFESDNSDYSESSVDIRVEETAFAMKSIEKYPFTGVGRIASSMKKDLLGNVHFFVSDIGLIGVLYTYGILGVLLYLNQIRTLFKRVIGKGLFSIEELAGYKLFLFFVVIHAALTGNTIFAPAEFLVTLSIILAGQHQLQTLRQQDEND